MKYIHDGKLTGFFDEIYEMAGGHDKEVEITDDNKLALYGMIDYLAENEDERGLLLQLRIQDMESSLNPIDRNNQYLGIVARNADVWQARLDCRWATLLQVGYIIKQKRYSSRHGGWIEEIITHDGKITRKGYGIRPMFVSQKLAYNRSKISTQAAKMSFDFYYSFDTCIPLILLPAAKAFE